MRGGLDMPVIQWAEGLQIVKINAVQWEEGLLKLVLPVAQWEEGLHFFFFFLVSRNFLCLQMIFMDKIGFPDVPLEVYLILNFHFHVVF